MFTWLNKQGVKSDRGFVVTIWNRLTDSERWALNQNFLDEALSCDSEILLATPLNQMRKGGFYEREINYLVSEGYRLSPDRTRCGQ